MSLELEMQLLSIATLEGQIDRLRAERDALRVELAKERERADAHYRVLECVSSKRDELRALVRNVIDDDHCHMLAERTRARIEALLNKGGGNE